MIEKMSEWTVNQRDSFDWQENRQSRRLSILHLCLSLSLNKDSDKDNDKRNVKDKDKYSAAVCPTCIFVSLCPSTAQWRALCCGSSSHQIIQWYLMGGRTLNLFCQIFIGNPCNPYRAPPAPPFHPFASSLLRKYIVGHTSVWLPDETRWRDIIYTV